MLQHPTSTSPLIHVDPMTRSRDIAVRNVANAPEVSRNSIETLWLVLLVDDDEKLRNWLRRVLEPNGMRVIEAANGVDGLALFNDLSGAVDLVITDLPNATDEG